MFRKLEMTVEDMHILNPVGFCSHSIYMYLIIIFLSSFILHAQIIVNTNLSPFFAKKTCTFGILLGFVISQKIFCES